MASNAAPPVETTAVVVSERGGTVARAEDFLPLLSVEQAIQRKTMMNQFISKVLIEDVDYGKQQGGGDQKVLKKSGAEKMCSMFGLSPRIVEKVEVEDWTGKDHGGEPFFYYKYTIGLYRGDMFMGEAVGSCNSWESKYRYRWIGEDQAKQEGIDTSKLRKRGGVRTLFEPDFALDKMETTGRYGKPMEYWQMFRKAVESQTAQRTKKTMGKREYTGWSITVDETQYRVPNPDAADVVNTVQKMAFKRALVAPVLVVTNCSDAFTQDLDEDDDGGGTGGHPEPPPAGEGQPPQDEHQGTTTERPPQGASPAPQQQDLPGTAPQQGAPGPQPGPTDAEPRTPTSNRIIPTELRGIIDRLKAQPTGRNIEEAVSLLERFLVERYGPEKGKAEFKRVADAFASTIPKPQRTIGDYIEFFVDLWEAANVARPSAAKG